MIIRTMTLIVKLNLHVLHETSSLITLNYAYILSFRVIFSNSEDWLDSSILGYVMKIYREIAAGNEALNMPPLLMDD